MIQRLVLIPRILIHMVGSGGWGCGVGVRGRGGQRWQSDTAADTQGATIAESLSSWHERCSTDATESLEMPATPHDVAQERPQQYYVGVVYLSSLKPKIW